MSRIIEDTDRIIPNGTAEYYVSLNCIGETPAQSALLKYIKNCDGVNASIHFPNLVKRVNFIKEERQGETIMCEIMDEIIREEKMVAIAEGRLEGMVLILRKLNYSSEEITSYLIKNCDIEKSDVTKYLGE